MRTQLRLVGRFTGRTAVSLAAVVLVATGVGVVLLLMRSHWPSLDDAESDFSVNLRQALTGNLIADKAFTAIGGFGGAVVLWWLVTVGAGCMLIRHQRRLAIFFVVVGFGALVATPLTNALVAWLQPEAPNLSFAASGSTFPSAHTLNATVLCGALLLGLLPIVQGRPRRWVVGLTIVAVLLVGFSRAALGVERVSDLIGGWLVGLGWLGLTASAFRRWRIDAGDRRRPLSEGLEPEAAAQLTATRFAPVPHVRRGLAWLAAAWIFVVAVVAGLGMLVKAWSPGFDEAPSHWLAAQRTDKLTAWSLFWSDLGNTHTITLVLLSVVPLAVAATRRLRPAAFLLVLLIGESTIFVASSTIVDRDRPYVTLLDGHLPTSSFPSGHVAATTCLYGGLAVLLVPRARGWLRGPVLGLAVFMPLAIAASRLYRGAHHPLDVTGGALLALLWICAVTLAVRPNADLLEPTGTAADPVPQPRPTEGSVPVVGHGPGTRSAVVVNPIKLPRAVTKQDEIGAILAGAGWPMPTWHETTVEDPGGGQARQAVQDGAGVVFAAGGDGTVMACANALAGTGVALAVLPCGTGNLLARNLGLPMRLNDAVAMATADGRRQLDVGLVGDQCFLIMAGMGLDAQMLHDAPAKLKASVGWLAYGLAVVRHLCTLPMNVQIGLDGAPAFTRRARTVLVGNVGGLPGGLRLLPDAEPDDGVLDVAILMPPRIRDWFALAWALVRQRRTPPSMEVFRARHVEIRSDVVQPRQLDGELIAPSHAMTASIRTAALWLCVPPPALGPPAPVAGTMDTATQPV
jgi:undecaprenyl-diphosphatase